MTRRGQENRQGCVKVHAQQQQRLERTRHERATLVSCVGEPLERNVMPDSEDVDGTRQTAQ